MIKLPFEIDPTCLPDEPDISPISIEEVDRLKPAIAKLEKDKENLEYNLYDMTYEKNLVSYDLEQKDKQLLESQKEIKTERSKRQKILGGLLGAGFNLETLNKLKEAQAEGQWCKRSWALAMWEQQERESALATQIRGLERSRAESQVVVARKQQLRMEVEQMFLNNWRRPYGELLNLRKLVHFQHQDHEALRYQVTQLEKEVMYLRDLVDVAQVIV